MSIGELEQMVQALQSLATVKEDVLSAHEQMTSELKTNDLQIEVLKQEVDIAADFLIDQEQRMLKAN